MSAANSFGFVGVKNSAVSTPAFAIFCPRSNSLNGISVKVLVLLEPIPVLTDSAAPASASDFKVSAHVPTTVSVATVPTSLTALVKSGFAKGFIFLSASPTPFHQP